MKLIYVYVQETTNTFSLDNDRIDPPTPKYVLAGRHTRFKCNSCTPPKWYFNFTMKPRNALEFHNLLHISFLDSQHQGYYECHGTNSKGEKFMAQTELFVWGNLQYLHNKYMPYCLW